MENENNKKRRGFFGRLVVGLLTLLACLGLIAMALSALSGYIDPKRFVWTSFFGLAFWEILAFNAVVFVLLLLLWSRKVWIAVLALAIAVPGILRSFSNGKAQSGADFRVMSYNVQIFKDLYAGWYAARCCCVLLPCYARDQAGLPGEAPRDGGFL